MSHGFTADLRHVTRIPDPATRAREAIRLMNEHARAIEDLARARKDAITSMHASGMSHAEIATALDLSSARVCQLAGCTCP